MANLRYVGSAPAVPDATVRKQDIDVYVVKTTTPFTVYTTDSNGNPDVSFGYSSGANANTIMYRTTGGVTSVGTPTANTHATTKLYVDTAIGGTVKNSGNETIGGIKTFTLSPIVPTPTTNTQVANKAYVDTGVEAAKTYTDNRQAFSVANASGQSLTLWKGTLAQYTALGVWDNDTIYAVTP